MAKTINGLYKTELIKRRGPWRTVDHVEYATADYVNWFNYRPLYKYCGDIPPVELEMAYHAQQRAQPTASFLTPVSLRTHRGGSESHICTLTKTTG